VIGELRSPVLQGGEYFFEKYPTTPHSHALTMELRGEDRHNAYRGVSEKCVPLVARGVLCPAPGSLRKPETADRETRTSLLTPPQA
jgi:hypothetical protein